MHGSIIQLSRKRLGRSDLLTLNKNYEDDSATYIAGADYIGKSYEPREKEIQYFMDWLIHEAGDDFITYDQEQLTVTFKVGFGSRFFSKRFEELRTLVNQTTLEEFSTLGMTDYYITNLACNPYGFQIYDDGSIMSLDEFVRYITTKYQEDVTYYIGGTLDYHY